MDRSGHKFQQHWHRRQIELDDGDTLRWIVIDTPGIKPHVAFYRADRAGGLDDTIGHRLLVEHDHPDDALGLRGDSLTDS